MAKKKVSVALKSAEIEFGEEIVIIEHLKEDDARTNLEDILRQFEGCTNLSISISIIENIFSVFSSKISLIFSS